MTGAEIEGVREGVERGYPRSVENGFVNRGS
jgi:hypothetical protein